MTRTPPTRCLLLLVLLLASLLPAQSPTATLRIGAWNLEQLGFREPARTDADLDAIAAFIRELGVAVLGVAEIGGEDALKDLCRRVGPTWDCLLGTTGGFREQPSQQIGVGFLWNRSFVELLHAEEPLDLPREADGLPIFHRVPVSACFRAIGGGPDFRAVVVHLKAGQKEDDEKKREAEVAALRAWLEALQRRPGEDPDIVVLGDFNHSYGARAYQRFCAGDFVRYLRREPLTPTIVHFDAPIDHIAVVPGFREPIATTFRVHNAGGLRDKEAWRRSYSDHFPVTVDLDAGPDDDPGATFAPPKAEHRLPARLRPSVKPPLVLEPVAPAVATPQSAKAAAELPISTGTRVAVVLHDGVPQRERRFEGFLLAPLGADWVYLRGSQGEYYAFPTRNVLYITTR